MWLFFFSVKSQAFINVYGGDKTSSEVPKFQVSLKLIIYKHTSVVVLHDLWTIPRASQLQSLHDLYGDEEHFAQIFNENSLLRVVRYVCKK